MKTLLCPSILLLTLTNAAAQEICDIDAARRYCDSNPIERVEGIWQLTGDDSRTVMIRRTAGRGNYVMTSLNCDDARILPGDTLATLTFTPDPTRFRLRMKLGPGIAAVSQTCAATLVDGDRGLTVEKPGFRFSLSPRLMFSEFWRLFFYYDNPARRIPSGMIRLYPQPDRGADSEMINL